MKPALILCSILLSWCCTGCRNTSRPQSAPVEHTAVTVDRKEDTAFQKRLDSILAADSTIVNSSDGDSLIRQDEELEGGEEDL